MTRVWVYQRMKNDSAVSTAVGNRIYESTSLDVTPHQKPFIMYRQTSETSLMRGDDGDACRQVGFMIFVHDIGGDYMQIDTIMADLRALFQEVKDSTANVIRCEWVETSDDFRDDDMGTILKFARIQVKFRV